MTESTPDTAPEEAPDAAIQAARMKTENARLRGELRQGLARAERAERSLERVQNSAKYQIGDLCVQAAKHPMRLFLLPRDLWRIYSLRRAKRKQPKPSGPIPVQRARRDELLDLEAARLLLPRTMARPGAPIAIAGALSRETLAAWSPYAAVTSVLPHEAADLTMDIDADIVVIESAAALPGESWAYLGDPSVSDRELNALRLIDAARERGRPVVFLRNTAPSHTVFLRSLAERCDLVVDGPGARRSEQVWHPGIDPRAWKVSTSAASDLVVLDGAVGANPLQVTRGTPTERAFASALREASGAMPLSAPDPARPVGLATRAALARAQVVAALPMAVPTRQVGAAPSKLGALVAGVPLLSGPDSDLEALGAEGLLVAPVASAIPEALAAAQDLTITTDGHQRTMRAIFALYGVPVVLQSLTDNLHLPTRPRAAWDMGLITTSPINVDAVLSQSWQPSEIVTTEEVSDSARTALGNIRVISLPGLDLRDTHTQRMASSCAHVVSDVDLGQPDGLLDLLIAAVLDQPEPKGVFA